MDSFLSALLLYQHKHDTALGLQHVTTMQRGLIWYFNTLQYQQYAYAQRIKTLLGLMQFGRSTIQELSARIQVATVEDANKMMAQVEEMHNLMKQTEKELKEYV